MFSHINCTTTSSNSVLLDTNHQVARIIDETDLTMGCPARRQFHEWNQIEMEAFRRGVEKQKRS